MTLSYYDDAERYDRYAEEFDPLNSDRQARRQRRNNPKRKPKRNANDLVEEVADATGIEGSFTTTYTPARYETEFLYDSLRSFYYEELISDVLSMVKGGKEASVYCCRAHPVTNFDLLAAKVYRPRQFRNLRNDAMYRQGRRTIGPDGKAVRENDHRTLKAIGNKTAFGAQMQHTSWLMYEYQSLQKLYQAGAAVPQPVASAENAILMSYHGDEGEAAPTLNSIRLDHHEAKRLFDAVLWNIELMLQHGIIHGDLSAYNILYWQGQITLIDFPQVVDSQGNPKAWFILQRDVTRICQYFANQGVQSDPDTIATRLWQQYVADTPENMAADESRRQAEEALDDDLDDDLE